MDSEESSKGVLQTPAVPFKKPVLIGKIGCFPRKIQQLSKVEKTSESDSNEQAVSKPPETPELVVQKINVSPAQKVAEVSNPIPYREPNWSGLPESPGKPYVFEVLKNGSIIETIDLMAKPFWIFGRLNSCDVNMQHPTISRYHAVLQFRAEMSETDPPGFYIYDLESTHGTFLNKNRLKPKIYARIQVGHMLKLGCSTRSYILTGPDEDTEEESALTVTELKQKRQEELRKREEERIAVEKREEEKRKKDEERGVDWGLGEDAEEETDLQENPYAQTNNEELYLDNPKKALRGFFEREGLDLEYDCTEQGFGQFLCKVELPIDDEKGRPIFAEVLHKGKKKEAVAQCALEACRILDRHGLLRQATHESRKRKPKNWEENDFYDSDDDTFLDRTGAVEKKREQRMQGKQPQKAETYESLMEQEKKITLSIIKLEQELMQAQNKLNNQSNNAAEESDSLDVYMKELKQNKPDKQSINKLKQEITKLKQEHNNIIKLINIARPTNLPALVPDYAVPSTSSGSRNLPVFGKRRKIKLQLPETTEDSKDDKEEEEEALGSGIQETASEERMETEENPSASSSENEGSLSLNPLRNFRNTITFRKFEKILEKELPPFAGRHQDKLTKILNSLKKLASDGDRMDVDWKMLEAKKRKVMKLISDMNSSELDEKLEFKVSSELNRILNELNIMTEQKFKVINKVKKMGNELKNISEQIDTDIKRLKHTSNEASTSKTEEDDEKRRKRNQKRNQQRQEKTNVERQRGYEEDANREGYDMWIPPQDQSGDGRTNLNDKLGY